MGLLRPIRWADPRFPSSELPALSFFRLLDRPHTPRGCCFFAFYFATCPVCLVELVDRLVPVSFVIGALIKSRLFVKPRCHHNDDEEQFRIINCNWMMQECKVMTALITMEPPGQHMDLLPCCSALVYARIYLVNFAFGRSIFQFDGDAFNYSNPHARARVGHSLISSRVVSLSLSRSVVIWAFTQYRVCVCMW